MKFLLWNLENFFLLAHTKAAYNQALKPGKKVEQIIALLDELDADVILLCEVGGRDSLELLTQRLKHEYEYFYTEGNSDRGIGIGYLVKIGFARVQFHTHHDLPLPPITLEDRKNPRHFSRDAAELWLCDPSGTPQLIVWGVHLKSAQDRHGNDLRGVRQRSAEVRGLVALVKKRQQEFPHVQQWLGGDFNGIAYGPRREPEFEHLAAQLPNHHDLLERLDTPPQQRWTFAMSLHEPLPAQLDYLFLPDQTPTPDDEHSGIVYFWHRMGLHAGPAQTSAQRELWPSDHLPLFACWSKCPFSFQ